MSPPSNWLDDAFGPAALLDESTELPKRSAVAFVGASVTAVDDPANKRTNINIVPTELVPDLSGFAQVKGPVRRTPNAKVSSWEVDINVIVPTTTPTVIFTLPLVSKRKYSVRGILSVCNDPMSAFAEWDIRISARNSPTGPVVEIINPTTAVSLVGPTGTSFVLAASIVGSNLVLTFTDPVGGRRVEGPLLVIEKLY